MIHQFATLFNSNHNPLKCKLLPRGSTRPKRSLKFHGRDDRRSNSSSVVSGTPERKDCVLGSFMSFHLSALLSSKRPPVNSSVQLVPCQWAEIASARGRASEERPRWRVKTRTTSGEHFLRSVVREARTWNHLSKLNHIFRLFASSSAFSVH